MYKRKNSLKLFGLIISLILFLFLSNIYNANIVKADTYKETEYYNGTIDEEDVSPRGLFTNLTLAIGGGNGEIWADVKNEFTLFPATVWVYVELYSSDTYQEFYTTMKLEKMGSIADLDMGNTIRISVPTGGKQRYWQARMRYRLDQNDWQSKSTPTFLYGAEGDFIQ